ncbi:hypothetical protein [Dietzia sp. 179-F 9C3 NHS]|uniref:hypothetical protein n=1 Tax=Dietzia sp. 179-F 9C3 NHS TaxID=3374295 RepID=UPI00387A14F8
MTTAITALRHLVDKHAELTAARQREINDMEGGLHDDYRVYDELHDDIGDLLIEHEQLLASLADSLDGLADAVAAHDKAEETGDGDDSLEEAIRVAARHVLATATGPDTDHNG